MELPGASQDQAHTYKVVRKHPVGHKMARRIAVDNGVEVDAKITILRERDNVALANPNAHACYMSIRVEPNDVVLHENVFPGGRVLISMHRSVFLSDESIVAHLVHELHEVRGLRQAFVDAGGWMLARDLFELVREGKKGNLHDRAWDEANRAVEEMRTRKNARD